MILFVIYLATVIFSFLVLLRVFRNIKKQGGYAFTVKETIVGLVIVPLIPVFNIVIAILHL